MILRPRSYQVEAVSSLYEYFGSHSGNPIVAMPTGTGKSVVIAMFLESIFRQYGHQKILVLTHVKELIRQNYGKLMQLWPNAPAGINSAGLNQRDTVHSIIFAGIGSVAKRAGEFGRVDLVIIDECHLVGQNESAMYQIFLAALKLANPALKVIGFTATPWRLGQGKLTEDGIFTDVCFDITGMGAFNRLIAEGYLSPLITKRTKTVLDTDGVRMRGGEYIPGELQTAVNKEEITRAALEEALVAGADRNHWLIFASGVQHADSIAEILTDLGRDCLAVHSKLPGGDNERDANIAAFKSGKVGALVNNNVLTTGFDFPGIDFILMLRPTQSPVLWVQMLGRGTRPCPEENKSNCLVLDFGGNTRRLGPINDPQIPRKKGEGGGPCPMRECDNLVGGEECGTICHPSVKICPCCEYVFPVSCKIMQAPSSGELIKGDLPIVEVFRVDHVTYARHQKIGKPDAMRVTYFCGPSRFSDFVCPEHVGYASRKAREWWADRSTERSASIMPATAAAMLDAAESLRVATHLRVWVNKEPYKQIMAYCYDGTAFGAQAASDSDAGPEVQVDRPTDVPRKPLSAAGQRFYDGLKKNIAESEYLDDDIPF